MIALVAGLLVLIASTAEAAPPRRCGLDHLFGCRTTNALVWDAGFERAMKEFAGRPRTDFLGLGRKRALSDELITVLGGPPDEPRRLSDGAYLFTACRAHNCPQKGAVVLSPKGDILAAAIITEDSVAQGNRDSIVRLSLQIFVISPAILQPWRKAIDDWADGAAGTWLEQMQRLRLRAERLGTRVWLITPTGKLQQLNP